MARRVNISKTLQEIRGLADIANRRPHPAVAWASPRPLQIRKPAFRRHLQVTVDPQDDLEQEVKITWV